MSYCCPPASNTYQFRVVLQGISPLVWRRILVRSDTTITGLHNILQILFDWSDEYLHLFHIHGKDYGCSRMGGIYLEEDPDSVRLVDFRLHRGERFHYLYNFYANWQCDIRLEFIQPFDPQRSYPICVGGKRASPPEDCRDAWAYMQRLDQHRYPPVEAMLVIADAINVLLKADRHSTFQENAGDLDELREAVDLIKIYEQFQPQHFERRYINAQLQALKRHGEVECYHRCKVDPPTTGNLTHLAVIYSLPRGNHFFFKKPSNDGAKGF